VLNTYNFNKWNSSKYACAIAHNSKDIPTYSCTNQFQVCNPVLMLINADCMQTPDCSQFCLQTKKKYIFFSRFLHSCEYFNCTSTRGPKVSGLTYKSRAKWKMLWGIYSAIYGEVNISVSVCVERKGDYIEK